MLRRCRKVLLFAIKLCCLMIYLTIPLAAQQVPGDGTVAPASDDGGSRPSSGTASAVGTMAAPTATATSAE